LVSTVYKNWLIDGKHVFYEQYNDMTRLGQMTHPFNGWTSLILLVIA
jgi:hypothetical protein